VHREHDAFDLPVRLDIVAPVEEQQRRQELIILARRYQRM